MLDRISASAPCRADFAGGTLDIWPLGLMIPGAMTVNAAIPVTVELTATRTSTPGTVRHRVGPGPWKSLSRTDAEENLTAAVAFHLAPDGGFDIEVDRQAPVGSGLGGSSTYGVALASAIAALGEIELEDASLVQLIQDLEARVLQAPTGCQDHWAAVKGGIHALHLEPGGNQLEPLDVDRSWLEARATVFFTGITHHSGMVNWQVIRRRLEGELETTRSLETIARAAGDCRAALLNHDTGGVAEALRTEWAARRRLAPEVCPEELGALEAAVRRAGASAFKACGAGGGGSVLIWHEPDAAPAVAAAVGRQAPGGRRFDGAIGGPGCRLA